MEKLWICERQRAGPLVKESRALRPRLSRHDSPNDRIEKNKILRPGLDSSVCRSRVDRLELRLALFGYEGWVYCLTFDPAHLPEKFRDVRKVWRAFLGRLKRWKNRPFDYVYLIEGKHGDHRYHIHMVVRYGDFSPAEIDHLWQMGEIHGEPLLLHAKDTYRRTAKYFNKESSDGIVIPVGGRTWVCSKSLVEQLPPVERWRDTSGSILIPDNVRISGRGMIENDFGGYAYAWYIEPKNSTFILNQ